MVLSFVSEKAAEEFIQFVGNEFEVELELNAYLHIEIPDYEFPEQEAFDELCEEAEKFGAVLL